MTCPRYDLHTHTKYLGCANETMEVPAILAECKRLGVTTLAITDHLNRPEQIAQHVPISRDIAAAEVDLEVYFGVELNFMSCDGPLAIDRQQMEECGFQLVVGGIHETFLDEYDLAKIIDIQHRHHLAICENPLVDVLVHPYWFGRGEYDRKGFPLFDSMKAVPEAYVRELGQAATATGTAIEINGGAGMINDPDRPEFTEQYMDYLTGLAEQGPMFTTCSDAHDVGHLARVNFAWDAVEQLGLSDERICRPKGKPAAGG